MDTGKWTLLYFIVLQIAENITNLENTVKNTAPEESYKWHLNIYNWGLFKAAQYMLHLQLHA